MKYLLSLLFLVLFFIWNTDAQTYYKHYDVEVVKNSSLLPYPWMGGLNNAQFANADVNHDGKKDIVVYDNYNRQFFVFLLKTVGSTAYTFAPQYAAQFPDISNWMILKDYNCDAIPDLFTYNGLSNTKVFKGYYDQDTLKFKLQQNGFFYNNGITNVYAVDVSRPIIEDINKDGDLDFISFETFGTYLYYYENQRVEKSLPCDTFTFNLVDHCWGNVRDTFSATYSIRDTCMGKFRLGSPDQILHTGSFMESADLDNNGKVDLLIGNIGIQNITALYNMGSFSYASILKQDARYPSYNTSFSATSMATPMKLDADGDGRNDLIVSTFDVGSNNIDNIYWYKNLSADSFNLSLQTKNFLLTDIIDNGENSAPCIFDYNGDGLKDILIGNGGYKDNIHPIKYTLELYKNIGSDTLPKFELVNADYLDVSTFGIRDLIPNAGDIDNDGDTDLIAGFNTGNILWWENTAGNGNIPVFVFRGLLKDNAATDILVEQQAAPFIADVNGDGNNDLLIGDKNGRISYYSGSGNNSINLALVTSNYGKIRTNSLYNNFGYAQPTVADINHDGLQDLVLGSNSIGINWYNNYSSHQPNDSLIPTGMLLGNKIYARSTTAIADLDSDNKLEILVGNYNGGLWYYSEKIPTVTAVKPAKTQTLSFNIFPNPAGNNITLEFDNKVLPAQGAVYSIDGKNVLSFEVKSINTQLNIADLPKGIYLISVYNQQYTGTSKFVKE